MMAALRLALPTLKGREIEGLTIAGADDFAYTDPVDGSVSKAQGVRILFEDGSRIVLRLSGTGTEGATLRLYLERYAAGPMGLDLDPQEALAPMIRAAHELAGIERLYGPDGTQRRDLTLCCRPCRVTASLLRRLMVVYRGGGDGNQGRSGRQARQLERSKKGSGMGRPYIVRNIPPYDVLSEENLVRIEAAADRVLAETGIEFRDDPVALDLWRRAGARVDGVLVKFEPGMLREILKSAPSEFTQHARNPANNVRDWRQERGVLARLWQPVRDGSGPWPALWHAGGFPQLHQAGAVQPELSPFGRHDL